MSITQPISTPKTKNFDEMTTDIKDNLLDDSILANTFEKVIKFEIKKQFFHGMAFLPPHWHSKG